MQQDNNTTDINKSVGFTQGSDAESFFSSNSIEHLLNTLREKRYTDNINRNNLILDVIRIKQPISKYGLAKLTGLSYPTIKQVCKEFEFSGLVKIRVSMGENGLPRQLVYIPNGEEKNEKNK